MLNTISMADTVFLKVEDLNFKSLKNFIAINKCLPENTPKSWGHKFYPELHSYAIMKNNTNLIEDIKICIIFSPRIGTIKKIYPISADLSTSSNTRDVNFYRKYDVLWEERNDCNREKGLGRHNELETYYEENLVLMKNIDKFLSKEDFEQFCLNIV